MTPVPDRLTWDHTVHYVDGLDRAVVAFAGRGLVVTAGGAHERWGTHNALLHLGLPYVEFLGIADRAVAERVAGVNRVTDDLVARLPDHEVFGHLALRTPDIAATHDRLRRTGVAVREIVDGHRRDPAGETVRWRMATIDGEGFGGTHPFLIEWPGTDAERLEGLRARGVVRDHPAGPVTPLRAEFRVPDPAGVARAWADLLDRPAALVGSSWSVEAGEGRLDFAPGPENRMVRLVLGTGSTDLAGRSVVLGEGEYVFEA